MHLANRDGISKLDNPADNSHESPLLRAGIRTAIEAEDGVDVVGEAGPGPETLALVSSINPSIVLMGLSSHDQEEADLCHQVTAEAPFTKVLVISYQDPGDDLLDSVIAGASGLVTHDADGPELLRAIGVVFNGGGILPVECGAARRYQDERNGATPAVSRHA